MTHTVNVEDSLRSFLAEDVGYGDITTDAIIDSKQYARARVICKEEAMIAGLDEALLFLKLAGCKGTTGLTNGARVRSGTTILSAIGPARELLKVERTLLNLLSHMSGVATVTAELVKIVKQYSQANHPVRIAATRKTLPGLRFFEKKAVEIGGGDSHRLGLDDAVLIKDNHLVLNKSLTSTVERARARTSFTKKIEVEVTNVSDAVEAAKSNADIILFDNMNSTMIAEAIGRLKKLNLRNRVILEASGGITRNNLAEYVQSGVDIISVGAITHSAKSIDMSMKLSPVSGARR